MCHPQLIEIVIIKKCHRFPGIYSSSNITSFGASAGGGTGVHSDAVATYFWCWCDPVVEW